MAQVSFLQTELTRRSNKYAALGNFFVLLGAILQALPSASSPKGMYLAGRFLIGFGSNISNGTCPLLITEVSHPRHRGRVRASHQ